MYVVCDLSGSTEYSGCILSCNVAAEKGAQGLEKGGREEGWCLMHLAEQYVVWRQVWSCDKSLSMYLYLTLFEVTYVSMYVMKHSLISHFKYRPRCY